jgi:hypothetical protein
VDEEGVVARAKDEHTEGKVAVEGKANHGREHQWRPVADEISTHVDGIS